MIFASFQPDIREIIERVASTLAEEPVFLVGGAVRDALCGRQIHDLDFAVSTRAISAGRRIAKALNADFYPLDEDRDTGRVILRQPNHERLLIDFAALRGEDLENDLRARDFTVNAIAVNIHAPERLVDPTGGTSDLLHKRLRPCSENSFRSDPVRILRAARFSQEYGLKIDADTLQLIRSALSGINQTAMERIRDELFRTFQGETPWNAVRLLEAFGVLPEILPELWALKGLEQPAPHTLDAYEHSITTMKKIHQLLMVLGPVHEPEEGTNLTMGLVSLELGRFREQVSQHLAQAIHPERSHLGLLSLAALYHDTGKATQNQIDADGSRHFFAHEKASEEMVHERSAALRLSKAEIDWLATVVAGHMRPLWLSKTNEEISRRAIYRFFRDTGSAGVDICLLSLADILAAYGSSLPQDYWMQHLRVVKTLLNAYWEMNEKIVSPSLLLNGDELMNLFHLKQGPIIGKLLEMLREAQAADEIQNREEAIQFIGDCLIKDR